MRYSSIFLFIFYNIITYPLQASTPSEFPNSEELTRMLTKKELNNLDIAGHPGIVEFSKKAHKLIEEDKDQQAGPIFTAIFPKYFNALPMDEKIILLSHFLQKMQQSMAQGKSPTAIEQMSYFIEPLGPYMRKLMEQIPSLMLDSEWNQLITQSTSATLEYTQQQLFDKITAILQSNVRISDPNIKVLGVGNISTVYKIEAQKLDNLPDFAAIKLIRPASFRLAQFEKEFISNIVSQMPKTNQIYFEDFEKRMNFEFNLNLEAENILMAKRYYNDLAKQERKKVIAMELHPHFKPTENILPLMLAKGVTIHKWLKNFVTLTQQQQYNLCLFLGIVIQDTIQLYITTAKEYGFIHADLHKKNIIAWADPKLLETPIQQMNNPLAQIKNLDQIPWGAMIIDFGKVALLSKKEKKILIDSIDLIKPLINASMKINFIDKLIENKITNHNVHQFWHSFMLLQSITMELERLWNTLTSDTQQAYPFTLTSILHSTSVL